jgi:hypothetical protein
MVDKKSRTFVKRTFAALSGVVASSFVVLPVLAQTHSSQSNQYSQCVPARRQSNSSMNRQSTLAPISSSTPGTSRGAADVSPSGNAAGTGVPVLPNQSDPRSIPSTQGRSVGNDMGTSRDTSDHSMHRSQTRTSMNNCPPGMVPRSMDNQQSQDQNYPDTPAKVRANPNRNQTPSNQ